MSVMGVDVGTTGVKAVVFDAEGTQLGAAYEEYPLLFQFAGAAELKSRAVLAAAMRVIGRAAAGARRTDPVAAVAIASQGEAFTPVGRDGGILGNIMTSSDARAASLVDEVSGRIGPERLYQITGHTPHPMYSLFKLEWLRRERPQVWERTWKFLFTQDLLAHALTGRAATEASMAARSMLFDVRALAWSDEILTAIGLRADKLPEVLQAGEPLGTVLPAMAAELGLAPGATVSVCGHDQPVGGLGCGAVEPGCASYSMGTVECLCPALDGPRLGPALMRGNLACYPHVLPGLHTTVAFNITGGSVLKWLRDTVATDEARKAREAGIEPYEAIIAAAGTEPARLILGPHFGPTGTPHFDQAGAGILFGLKLSTPRGELIRAVLEGITYEMRWNLEILAEAGFPMRELRGVGGGARSEALMRIKADILGVPLAVMRVTEATCMGAALLGGAGLGWWDAATMAAQWARPVRIYEPDPARAAAYTDRFAIYRELYGSLAKARTLLHNLS